MAILNYIVNLCLLTLQIQAYRIIQSDEANTIFAMEEETIDIVCAMEEPISQCGFTHPNGTKILSVDVPNVLSCKFTIKVTSSDRGLWICHIMGQTSYEEIKKTIDVRVTHKLALSKENNLNSPDYIEHVQLNSGHVSGALSDDDPIVISTTTYVCSTIAFLGIFVLLVYWKYRYYTVYYGKTWGDDDSIDSRVMKIQADDTAVVQAGDYLLIT